METIKGIYIDLDSFFDTRLGVLAEVNLDLVTMALDGGHLTRTCDEYSFMLKKTFNELYSIRSASTLKLSPITGVHKVLASACVNMLKGSIDSPEITGVKVTVNMFPFKLSEQEIGDLLELIVSKTGNLVQVELIYLEFKDLTFKYCEPKFDLLFIYDYMNFIENNVKNNEYKKYSLNDRILVAPEIYLRDISPQDINKVYRKNPGVSGYTVSEALKSIASPSIMLELIESSIFSVDMDYYVSDKVAEDREEPTVNEDKKEEQT